MTHKHHHCQHPVIKYCSHCGVAYCIDCNKEWYAEQQIVYRHYPFYTYNGVSWTYCNSRSSCDASNAQPATEAVVTCTHHHAE